MKVRDESLSKILEKFAFLVRDFGFSKPEISHAGPICTLIEFKGSEIVVQLDIDWREGQFYAFFRRPEDRDQWVGRAGITAVSSRLPFETCKESPEVTAIKKKGGTGDEVFRLIINDQSRILHCLLSSSSDWLGDFFNDARLL